MACSVENYKKGPPAHMTVVVRTKVGCCYVLVSRALFWRAGVVLCIVSAASLAAAFFWCRGAIDRASLVDGIADRRVEQGERAGGGRERRSEGVHIAARQRRTGDNRTYVDLREVRR